MPGPEPDDAGRPSSLTAAGPTAPSSPRAGAACSPAAIATAACAVPLDERDLLRVGAFVAVLPLLALLLALATRRTVRVHAEAVAAAAARRRRGDGRRCRCAARRWSARCELVDTVPDAAGPGAPPPGSLVRRLSRARRRRCTTPCGRSRRGVHRIGPLVACGTDPLGAGRVRPHGRRARTGSSCCPGTVAAARGARTRSGSSDGAHGAGARRAPARVARTSSCGPTAAATSCGGCTGAARPGTTS